VKCKATAEVNLIHRLQRNVFVSVVKGKRPGDHAVVGAL
jgi:hypothetical protein